MNRLHLKLDLKIVIRSVMGILTSLMLTGCSLDLFGSKSAARAEDEAAAATARAVTESANLQMARTAFNNSNYGIAISHLERELALRPESIAALNGLGASYDQLGRFDVAQRYYFRALELASDPATTLANLGYSNQLQGNASDAAQILELALYYAPGNEVARANLYAVMSSLSANLSAMPDAPQSVTPPADAAVVSPAAAGTAITRSTVASSAVTNSVTQTLALRVEVSNGNGINGMAARVRSILQERSGLLASGGDVVRLTNADSFDYPTTVVYYRRGQAEAVSQLLHSLPLQNLRLEESDQLAPGVDVRVLLGRDYIPYDSRG